MKLLFSPPAARAVSALPADVARRIVHKMQWFAAQENPLAFAKPLKDTRLGSHRFRVGAYRIFITVHRDSIDILFVLAVRHRKEAYQL